ncbi:NAD+ synthase [Rhodoblastus acidophilus]|uniref:Glutamine-dependent NAD(+) synthetase n=1 Tax=Candidatus Rhodoblastus alkanivorans TaxID=2954117 RepID=A0ABS9Z5N0_9HYPH|nr:NAD+ synthase [Candidatus Rhodoblastus alkanivorans]MCI4677588.1 NAD+ synthase [Candidatus Rhodoblastus alkanivorans]MCI4682680.1 NAD+ synthase [Candidatus Rhodoblastus alkanivorans]MDI4639987.1 NAD+ synthase [Rhodoblastus acidophilus]
MIPSTSPLDCLVLALAQINCVVGAIDLNLEKARAAREKAKNFGADLVMFSELFLAGYPPEDLVLKQAFQDACRAALEELARDTADGGPAVLMGLPWMQDGFCHNAYALLDGGRIAAVRFKVDLPNYGVFDEKRVFAPGPAPGPVAFRGVRLGLPICEDIWGPDVVESLSETGAEIVLSPNGSPYWRGKDSERLAIVTARVVESGLPMVYLNQIGGQDELVFDGASFIVNADGGVAGRLPAFVETVSKVVFHRETSGWVCCEAPDAPSLDDDKADYAACVLGLRDYVHKNNFPGVVLGMSGGVDSALCAAMAADALGSGQVHAIMLPFRFTSQESLKDAADCATGLGLRYDILPIAPAVEGVEAALAPLFAGTTRGVTEENIQARARGILLMSVSNKFGPMLVTTGNKSEMSVGYATLYGDMNGGFNPIKDLYKTQVFRLCDLRNGWKPDGALGPAGPVIPQNIIDKPPTAELRENQKDQDSLPPYDALDDMLECLVERDMRLADIVGRGHDPETVKKIERLLYLAEYKRRQSAPGVKVTRKNFGRDRRYPIVNRFRDSGASPFRSDPAVAPESPVGVSERFEE